jgi:E3 ubiquitin-protein ligase UBR7
MLRTDPVSGGKGVHSQEATKSNYYNHNFQNRFCGCGEEYDAVKEKGTMFQCLGLGTVETGGCGEDWWHPQCLMGLPKDWQAQQEPKAAPVTDKDNRSDDPDEEQEGDEEAEAPPGFPHEDEFESMVCYKCVESNPWIKQYAGTPGFLPAVFKRSAAPSPEGLVKDETPTLEGAPQVESSNLRKRKASDDDDHDNRPPSPSKRLKDETEGNTPNTTSAQSNTAPQPPQPKHSSLPLAPTALLTLFLKEDFRDYLCHCPACFPNLLPHPQLVDEEETYEPPLSESGGSEAAPGSGARSHGTGSLLERGEAALSGIDRVRAIEGVMVYNNLKEKVKAFLKPYAESRTPVGAEDIKAYFEKLRGDDQAILEASRGAGAGAGAGRTEDGDGSGDGAGANRKEQSGY